VPTGLLTVYTREFGDPARPVETFFRTLTIAEAAFWLVTVYQVTYVAIFVIFALSLEPAFWAGRKKKPPPGGPRFNNVAAAAAGRLKKGGARRFRFVVSLFARSLACLGECRLPPARSPCPQY